MCTRARIRHEFAYTFHDGSVGMLAIELEDQPYDGNPTYCQQVIESAADELRPVGSQITHRRQVEVPKEVAGE